MSQDHSIAYVLAFYTDKKARYNAIKKYLDNMVKKPVVIEEIEYNDDDKKRHAN